MIITAMLVRDSKGYFEVSAAGEDRKEAFLSLGALERTDAERAAEFQLDVFKYPRIEITADIHPNGVSADTPFLQFNVGDRVTVPGIVYGTQTLETVQSLTASIDDVGNVNFGMTVKDPFLSHEERIERVLAKGHDGSFVGRTAVASQPHEIRSNSRRTSPAPVTFDDATGTLTTGAQTGAKAPDRAGTFRKATLDIYQADGTGPATDVVVDIEYPWDPSSPGSNVVATVTVVGGTTHGEVAGVLAVDPGSNYGAVLADDGGGFQTMNLRIVHS